LYFYDNNNFVWKTKSCIPTSYSNNFLILPTKHFGLKRKPFNFKVHFLKKKSFFFIFLQNVNYFCHIYNFFMAQVCRGVPLKILRGSPHLTLSEILLICFSYQQNSLSCFLGNLFISGTPAFWRLVFWAGQTNLRQTGMIHGTDSTTWARRRHQNLSDELITRWTKRMMEKSTQVFCKYWRIIFVCNKQIQHGKAIYIGRKFNPKIQISFKKIFNLRRQKTKMNFKAIIFI
jgi:hypothetical protein